MVNPRVRRVLETALDCDDLPRSASFYRSLLGVTPMLDTERLVAIDAGEGTVLLLFQKGAASSVTLPGGLIPAHDSGGSGHFAFAVVRSGVLSDMLMWVRYQLAGRCDFGSFSRIARTSAGICLRKYQLSEPCRLVGQAILRTIV